MQRIRHEGYTVAEIPEPGVPTRESCIKMMHLYIIFKAQRKGLGVTEQEERAGRIQKTTI